ncbi:MAG: hydroxyacid dehydrogenase [Bdellovibrionota bacterium]
MSGSGKVRVLITDGMAKDGVEILNRNPSAFEVDLRKATPVEELEKIIGDYECIVIRSATTLTKGLIDRATKLKLIVRAGAGVDNIDVGTASAKKVPVMNTATANSLAAAEQSIALMFAMLRMLPQAAWTLREGKWDRDSFKGYEATGKTLGVVGLGNIGRIVAEKARGLGMNVIGFDPMIQGSILGVPWLKVCGTLDELLKEAHIVTLHIPKSKETTNLFNSDRLGSMRDKSFLINCSRGGIVDENAVLAAIDSGKLSGAAFDVYEKEPPVFPQKLFTHPKVVCAPHLGASTYEAQDRVALTAANQIVAYFGKNERTGVVNAKEVWSS